MMDQQNVVRPRKGLAFSFRKDRSADTGCTADEPEGVMLSEEARQILCASTYRRGLERNSWKGERRYRRLEGNCGAWVLNRRSVSGLQGEKVLAVDGGDGCPRTRVSLMLLSRVPQRRGGHAACWMSSTSL